jgi:GAF domain-containing protein
MGIQRKRSEAGIEMEMKKISESPRKRFAGLVRLWQFLVKPHKSIQEIGEQRLAQLAISLILVIELFNILGFIASTIRNGFTESFGGFGFSMIGLLVAYALAKTLHFRIGAFLFSFAFSFSAYIDIVRQKGSGDIAADILVFIPLSLVIASTFLTFWPTFLLMGLNIGALVSLPYFGITLPSNLGGLAGIITVIGFVLILLGNFRNQTENLRLADVRNINRELENLTETLEQRVKDRTQELEMASEQMTRRAAQLQTITELSETIASLRDLNELFAATTRLISERFGFYHVGIFLIDESHENAILQAANSEGGQRMLARSHSLKTGVGVVGFCAQTGRPRIALDVGADAVYFDNPDLPTTRSEVALPLKSRGQTIGVLDVQSTEAGAFTEEDLQVLITLSNQVSIAIENTRLLTETRSALAQVQDVYDEFTRAEWGRTISKAEQPGFRYHIGRIEMLEKALDLPEVVSAVRNGQIEPSRANGSAEKRTQVAIPVKIRGEVIGIIHVESNDSSRAWKDDEISLVEAVAERAALAMENARLFQDARRRAAKEQAISQATSRITNAINIENILHATAEELERVLGGSEVVIRFQDKERQ